MELLSLLERKNISQYRLAKMCSVPQTTISDICLNKSKINKCSAYTLFKIASSLKISVEDFFTKEIDNTPIKEFEVFKSSICHSYKKNNYESFIEEILLNNYINNFYDNKEYAKAFYLLAFVDYICDQNGLKRYKEFDKYRSLGLLEPIFPSGILLLDKVFKTNSYKRKALKEAIPQFKRFNIIESDLENVA